MRFANSTAKRTAKAMTAVSVEKIAVSSEATSTQDIVFLPFGLLNTLLVLESHHSGLGQRQTTHY